MPKTIVQPLTAAVTAYLQLPGGWFRNNAGWITGSERTLLVDTCATEARSRHLIEAASATHPETAVSAVLTHAHGDHANGAGLVADAGGTVMGSAAATAEIAAGPHTFPAMFRYESWGEISPPTSTDTVTEPTTVDLGGVRAEIIPVPGHAHTEGDLVVWCPEEGVLFTGDLVFNGVTPLALQGSVLGWLDALDWLESFQARHLVPGHGPVVTPESSTSVPEPLTAVRTYLRWLVDAVPGTDSPDFDALEQRARARWARWLDAERHAANLRVAHAEVHGRPADPLAAGAAMVRSAGGPIHLDI